MADKKIALITGANKGIGLETARQLGTQGVMVLVGARDPQKAAKAVATLNEEGIVAERILLDVADTDSITAAAVDVEARFGRLDILINNAGVATHWEHTSQESEVSWQRVFETNVFGLVNTTHAFLPLLRRSKEGRIVNLSSNVGSMALASDPASPIAAYIGSATAYAASKAAVNMYTIHLARELAGTPIKVNAAHPGWVKTDMGGADAHLGIIEDAKTSVHLATLPADGPNGGYFHLGQTLPW